MRVGIPLIVAAAAGCSTAPIAGLMDHIDKKNDRREAIHRAHPGATDELPPEPPPDAVPVKRPSGPPPTAFDPMRKYEQEQRELDREEPSPTPRRPTPLETASKPKRPAEPDVWDEEPIPPRRAAPRDKVPDSDEREYR